MCECECVVPGGGVPDAGRSVPGSGEDVVAVGRPRHRRHVAGVCECECVVPGGGVPDAGCAVLGSGEDVVAVGRPRHLAHPPGVAAEDLCFGEHTKRGVFR